MNKSIKPYDSSSFCSKCGFHEVSTNYHNSFDCHAFGPNDVCWDVQCNTQEHLLRTCNRCSYEWVEATI